MASGLVITMRKKELGKGCVNISLFFVIKSEKIMPIKTMKSMGNICFYCLQRILI